MNRFLVTDLISESFLLVVVWRSKDWSTDLVIDSRTGKNDCLACLLFVNSITDLCTIHDYL